MSVFSEYENRHTAKENVRKAKQRMPINKTHKVWIDRKTFIMIDPKDDPAERKEIHLRGVTKSRNEHE